MSAYPRRRACGCGQALYAEALLARVDAARVEFLQAAQVSITLLRMGHVSLDLNVFPLNHSGTKKEGVGCTCAGYDGHAPTQWYLGEEGVGVSPASCAPAPRHSQREFLHVLERVLLRARALTALPLWVRCDAGNRGSSPPTTWSSRWRP